MNDMNDLYNMNEMEDLRDVAFWLSVEDYIMASMPMSADERCFLAWRVRPCVVIGKNQIAEAEMDLAAAKSNNVGVTRRSSGGGAVYLDPGAIQYAVIQPYAMGLGDDAMKIAREEVAGAMARALNNFGVAAKPEGRNDITAGGAKVSGISQLTRGGRLNTHGTLLYDTDLEILSRLLRPDTDKFQSKAVQSVRRRVSNIKPLITDRQKAPETGVFMKAVEEAVRKDAEASGRPFLEFVPTERELVEIERIRGEVYANPDNTFRSAPPYTYRSARRFSQGKVEAYIDVKNGVVTSCALRGDFIGVLPVDGLERELLGLPFQLADFSAALGEDDVKNRLGGVSKAEFLGLIFD